MGEDEIKNCFLKFWYCLSQRIVIATGAKKWGAMVKYDFRKIKVCCGQCSENGFWSVIGYGNRSTVTDWWPTDFSIGFGYINRLWRKNLITMFFNIFPLIKVLFPNNWTNWRVRVVRGKGWRVCLVFRALIK